MYIYFACCVCVTNSYGSSDGLHLSRAIAADSSPGQRSPWSHAQLHHQQTGQPPRCPICSVQPTMHPTMGLPVSRYDTHTHVLHVHIRVDYRIVGLLTHTHTRTYSHPHADPGDAGGALLPPQHTQCPLSQHQRPPDLHRGQPIRPPLRCAHKPRVLACHAQEERSGPFRSVWSEYTAACV